MISTEHTMPVNQRGQSQSAVIVVSLISHLDVTGLGEAAAWKRAAAAVRARAQVLAVQAADYGCGWRQWDRQTVDS
jgi:hypothetical protein